jgi:flagellar protein FliL
MAKPAEDETTVLPPSKPKGRKLITSLIVVAALAVGGGGATAYFLIFGGGPKHAMAKATEPSAKETEIQDPMAFIDVQRLMVPLYEPDGKLQHYVSVDLALEVRTSKKEFVQQRLSLVRHALNQLSSTTDLRNPQHVERLDFDRAAKLMLVQANKAIAEANVKSPISSLSIVSAMPL